MQCAWSKFEPRGFVISRGNLLEVNRPSCNYAHARLIRHQKNEDFDIFVPVDKNLSFFAFFLFNWTVMVLVSLSRMLWFMTLYFVWAD